MKTKHNIFALAIIGLLYVLSISILQPTATAIFNGPALSQQSSFKSQEQLTNPIFFESQALEYSITLDELGKNSAPPKIYPFVAIATMHQNHTAAAINYLSIAEQLTLKTRKVDLLFPSHYFW